MPTRVRRHGRSAAVGAGNLALVALGGALGGPARWAVESLAPPGTGLPWGTFLVNVSGAFALGVLLDAWGRDRSRLLLTVGTGFLGSFTTFSSWVLQVAQLSDTGRVAAAAAYLGCTLVSGVVAAVAGGAVGRRILAQSTAQLPAGPR